MKLSNNIIDIKRCDFALAKNGKMTICGKEAVYKYGRKFLCEECARDSVFVYGDIEKLKALKKDD
jgi:hypothetical protein